VAVIPIVPRMVAAVDVLIVPVDDVGRCAQCVRMRTRVRICALVGTRHSYSDSFVILLARVLLQYLYSLLS
jgi:hypothetical protein